MLKSDFAYDLPAERIAQAPLAERDQARLLHLGRDDVAHRTMADWPELLGPDDLVVVNNTRVIPARLRGVKDSGGAVELLVERIEDERTALCQARVSKPLKRGRWLLVCGERLEIGARVGEFHRLRFPQPVMAFLQRHGQTPLPPYIDRAVEVALMHRVHPKEPRPALRVGAPTLADRHPNGPRRIHGRARRPVGSRPAQVVKVAVGNPDFVQAHFSLDKAHT